MAGMSPGERLRHVMGEQKVSQRELARRCAANPASTTDFKGWRTNLNRYLNHGGGIDPAQAAIMAEELGVSPREFLVPIDYTQADVDRLIAEIWKLQGYEPTRQQDEEPEDSDDDYGIGSR